MPPGSAGAKLDLCRSPGSVIAAALLTAVWGTALRHRGMCPAGRTRTWGDCDGPWHAYSAGHVVYAGPGARRHDHLEQPQHENPDRLPPRHEGGGQGAVDLPLSPTRA